MPGDTLQLVRPQVTCAPSYLEAVQEFRDEARPLGQEDPGTLPPAAFVAMLQRPLRNPDGVPFSVFWLVDRGDFIGRLAIRHWLDAKYFRLGGHIGYVIRPSRRRQGFGTRILGLGLGRAGEMGHRRVLVTCDAGNVGSRRIIEANGGQLQNRIGDKLRYWIDLTAV